MDRDEVYREMIRVLRSNGFNDLALAIRDGKDGLFMHYIPFTDVVFNGKNVMKVVTTTGKLVSVRFSDVVKIESITSIQEGDIHV